MLTLLLTATLLVGAPLSAVSTEDPARPDWPRTRAERTENQETSTLADVEDFIAQLIARGAPIRRETLGISAENREIPLVICADPMVASGAEARATGRLVIYLQANIHGGEIEGKEVVQMLLRELAAGVHPQWLTRCVFVCTPIYNTDGNEAWGPGLENRAHQNGPPIVGRRPNGQGLDLNRDCRKASSPEMRAAEATNTFLAPASRAIWMICSIVVPRTIESSTNRTFLFLNSRSITLNFCRTDFLRCVWPGMMNVRPI